MKYTIKNLKEQIESINTNNDDLVLLGIISMNEEKELFNPYILYISLNNKIYSINVSCDLVMLNEFNSTEDLLEELNLNSAYKCFIKNNSIKNNINKKTPLINAMSKNFEFNEYQNFWTNEFIIAKKDKLFAVFTSDDFQEVPYNDLMNKIIKELNINNPEKMTDYKRLDILGYNSKQINEIIKSKTIIDIEPYINMNTSYELMKHYNKIGKDINPEDKEIFINCIRINANVDFLNQPYSTQQKEEIFINLLNGSKTPSFLTPEYSTEQISAIFSVLNTNEECTDFSFKYSLERIYIMKNKNYNILCDKVKNMDIEKIKNYLNLYEKYNKISTNIFLNYININYENEQLIQIYDALNNEYTKEQVDIFSSYKYSAEQMFLIKKSLEYIPVEKMKWVTPEYTPSEILKISNLILKNKKINKYLKSNETTTIKTQIKKNNHYEDIEK